jgi:hypothetical protein
MRTQLRLAADHELERRNREEARGSRLTCRRRTWSYVLGNTMGEKPSGSTGDATLGEILPCWALSRQGPARG